MTRVIILNGLLFVQFNSSLWFLFSFVKIVADGLWDLITSVIRIQLSTDGRVRHGAPSIRITTTTPTYDVFQTTASKMHETIVAIQYRKLTQEGLGATQPIRMCDGITAPFQSVRVAIFKVLLIRDVAKKFLFPRTAFSSFYNSILKSSKEKYVHDFGWISFILVDVKPQRFVNRCCSNVDIMKFICLCVC